MAEIVFGFGTSHSPQLALLPEEWEIRAQADRENPAHPFRGKVYGFDELAEARCDENLENQLEPEVRQERHNRCLQGLASLSRRIAEIDPDVLVIIGDDQRDWFFEDNQPAFAVYYGDDVVNRPPAPERIAGASPGVRRMQALYRPETDRTYPVAAGLARHVIETAMDDGFDVAVLNEPPAGENGALGIGHAYGFVYRRLLDDRPVPLVPVFINTYYPPNQPTARRCYDFGRSIGRAIASWRGPERVAVAASGGLSHFAIDEALDRRLLDALLAGDVDGMTGEPELLLQSGTSEVKNWIVAAGALAEAGLNMTLLDYVPCYRSIAGTGTAMAFATWT